MPPVRVKTPQTPTFCFAREFCTAEARSPAPPVRAIACSVWAMASFGSYARSSLAVGLYTCSSLKGMTQPGGDYWDLNDCFSGLSVQFMWAVSRPAEGDSQLSSTISFSKYDDELQGTNIVDGLRYVPSQAR